MSSKAPLMVSGLVLLAALGCAKPETSVSHAADGFALVQLQNQKVALWPISAGDFDGTIQEALTEGWGGSKDKFLDDLGTQLGDRLKHTFKEGSLGPGDVSHLAMKEPAGTQLLDSSKLLAGWDPGNRFTANQPLASLGVLEGLPWMRGVQFLVIPVRLQMGRSEVTLVQGPVTTTPSPVGGPGMMTPGPTSASSFTHGNLRIVVVDSTKKSVVWDGAIKVKAPNNSFATKIFDPSVSKVRTLNEDLVKTVESGILGLPK